MKLEIYTLLITCIIFAVVAKETNTLVCPDYKLKCPTCSENETCIYPNSGGCEGAGIPICKSNNCHNIRCLVVALPCPKNCPFSCKYSGSSCCPFLGQPVCEPVCQTFVACKVTPCPKDCPGNCIYPDADYCCPKSGKAVCKNTIHRPMITFDMTTSDPMTPPPITMPTVTAPGKKHGYNNNGAHDNWGVAYSSQAKSWEYEVYYGGDDDDQGYKEGNGGYEEGHYHGNEHEQHHDVDYFEGGVGNKHCPLCTKTITNYDLSLEFTTTTRTSNEIICPQYILPCPDACPHTCHYPMNQSCPFTQQPWCPSVFDPITEEACDSIFVTEGYPFPYFPTYDPYHSVFTSILNDSGVTSTPSFITEIPTETPSHFCPLIFRMCPAECPDSCLRPDVPCPFAAEGYCPSSSTKITRTDTDITSSNSVDTTTHVVCPLYILACPYCPSGYTCTRATTGNCPNTNVPYCVSTLALLSFATPTSDYSAMYPTPTASVIYYR